MKFYRILKIFFIHSKVRGDNRKLDFTERNILVFVYCAHVLFSV